MNSKNQFCRICLLPCESMLCIFTSVEVPSLQNTTYPLIDVLRIFTDLSVSLSLPAHICKICLDEIQETYFFKLRYDTSLTEQPIDNVTKNTDDFHSEHEHHADTSIGLIKTEKDNEEYDILHEEQIKQENTTDECSELVTLKEEKLFVQQVKAEPEIDITDSLNETNPDEKCLQNNLQYKICLDEIQETYSFKLRYNTSLTEQPTVNATKNMNDFYSEHEHHADTSIGLIKTEKDNEEYEILNEEQLKQEDSPGEFSELVTLKEEKLFVQEVKEEPEIDITDRLNETNPNEKCLQNNLQCTVCTKCFRSEQILKSHMSVHSDFSPFQCKICAKIFRYKFELITHTKTEHEMYRCRTCSKLFEFDSQLNQHIMRFHIENRVFKPFRCAFCAAEFEYDGHLKRHLRTVCAQDDETTRFQCKICEDIFRDEVNCKNHIRTEHPKQNFKCTTCSKSSKIMFKNMIVHSDVRFQCDICPKKYINEKNLQEHLRTSHSKKLQATVTTAVQLQRPSIPKQNEVDQKKKLLQCDICPKNYINKKYFEAHLRTEHSKEPQAIAAQLQMVYKIPKQNEVVQKKKSFQCRNCPKKYINKKSLLSHLRNTHRRKAIVAIAAQLQKVYDIQKQNKVEQRKK